MLLSTELPNVNKRAKKSDNDLEPVIYTLNPSNQVEEALKVLNEVGNFMDRVVLTISIIKQIIELLVSADESNWADAFKSFEQRLDNLESRSLQTLRSDILRVYGGMGSFNDLVLYKEEQVLIKENQVLDKLRMELFDVLNRM